VFSVDQIPTRQELADLTQTIAKRIGSYLEREKLERLCHYIARPPVAENA